MTETYRAQLVHTLRSVLRPLARILFRAGVRFDEFVELLRGIYVEITIRDSLEVGQKISTGRISILSGVSKRDVERLVTTDDWLRIPKPTDAAALAAVLHRWHTDSAFLGPYGVPLELPITGQGGRNFTDLVWRLTRSRSIATNAYEQLLAAKMIVKSGDTHVKVLSRSYVMPEPLSPEMLEHFGSAMTNLASTLNFNMTPAQNVENDWNDQYFQTTDCLKNCARSLISSCVRSAQELISDVDDWLAAAARRPNQEPMRSALTLASAFFSTLHLRTNASSLRSM